MKFQKHTQDLICPGCDDRLKRAHNSISEFFLFFKNRFPNMHCSWVYRDKDDQEAAFASGASRAHFGESKHNLLPSEAVDIFQINEHGCAIFDGVFCANINKLAIQNGFNLKWGGEFKKIGDSGHFELK